VTYQNIADDLADMRTVRRWRQSQHANSPRAFVAENFNCRSWRKL